MIHLSQLIRLLQHESGMIDPVILGCNFTLCNMESIGVSVEDEGLLVYEKKDTGSL
jgi:hypothetical protein